MYHWLQANLTHNHSFSRDKTNSKREAIISQAVNNKYETCVKTHLTGDIIMFNIGDYVVNQRTGHLGQVIGYGHQILDIGYTSTLKVLVAESTNSRKRGFVEEDLYSIWVQWSGDKYF